MKDETSLEIVKTIVEIAENHLSPPKEEVKKKVIHL